MGLCKPVVGAWQVMCAWASVSKFLPHNSATLQFQVLVSMQMDVEFKKEQSGTVFVWVGALEGGFGGWVVPQGCPPQKVDTPFKKITPGIRSINRVYMYAEIPYTVLANPIQSPN